MDGIASGVRDLEYPIKLIWALKLVKANKASGS